MRRSCGHNKQRGATLVEYALLLACIAVVCIAGVRQIGIRAACRLVDVSRGLGQSSIPAVYADACGGGGGY